MQDHKRTVFGPLL